MNDNSSQHAFKKIKREYGDKVPLIKDYCSHLIKLQMELMDRKKKKAVANMKIISDNFGAGFKGKSNSQYMSSAGSSIYQSSVVGADDSYLDSIGYSCSKQAQ